jgi:hypothetical protein
MADRARPDPEEVAFLTVENVDRYEDEKGKAVSRLRMAMNTLRAISMRETIRDSFVEEWSDELQRLGWIVFRRREDFLLVKVEKADNWTKIASKRVKDILDDLAEGDRTSLNKAMKERSRKKPMDFPDDDDER